MMNPAVSAPLDYGYAPPTQTTMDPSMAAFYGAQPSYAAPYDFPYAGAPTVELGNPDEAPPPPPDEEERAAPPDVVLAEDVVPFPASLHRRPRLDHRRQTSQPFCIRRLSERPFVFPQVSSQTERVRRRHADADP